MRGAWGSTAAVALGVAPRVCRHAPGRHTRPLGVAAGLPLVNFRAVDRDDFDEECARLRETSCVKSAAAAAKAQQDVEEAVAAARRVGQERQAELEARFAEEADGDAVAVQQALLEARTARFEDVEALQHELHEQAQRTRLMEAELHMHFAEETRAVADVAQERVQEARGEMYGEVSRLHQQLHEQRQSAAALEAAEGAWMRRAADEEWEASTANQSQASMHKALQESMDQRYQVGSEPTLPHSRPTRAPLAPR